MNIASLCRRHGFPKLLPGAVQFGHLRFDEEASGDVMLDRRFLKMDALFRADVLQEVIGVLDHEYNKALDEAFPNRAAE